MVAHSPVDSPNAKLMLLAKQTKADKGYRLALVDQAAKTDQDTGTLKFLTDPGVTFFTWSPDGLKVAYVNDDGELWVMDALTGSNKKRIAATGVIAPNWSKK
jgi:Tol biopolymer transport system component